MLNELHSSKNDGERAVASSPQFSPFIKVKKIAEAPLVWRNKKQTPSIDSVVSNSAIRKFGMLNEPHSSKTDGEQAVASSLRRMLPTLEGKIAGLQHLLPHNNNPRTSAPSSATHIGLLWCSVDKIKEPYSSKIDGELASASTLSKEFYYYYRVSHLPLSECQLVCHYMSWLFQARNHVRWRGCV